MNIIYEDNHIIVVSKESGLLTQGDSSGKISLFDQVKEYIRVSRNKPGQVFLGLVHRLDRVVSGVVIFARTSKAASRLHQEFLHRRTVKIYLALVQASPGLPAQWTTLDHYIRNDDGRSTITTGDDTQGKTVSLRFTSLAGNDSCALLCIHLLTGKKHQIRLQLSQAGFPIIGDGLYGAREKYHDEICLHAYYLRIKHPTRDEFCEFYAKIPDIFHKKFNITADIEKKILDSIFSETTVSAKFSS